MKIPYHCDRSALAMLLLMGLMLVCVVDSPRGPSRVSPLAIRHAGKPGLKSVTQGIYHEDLAGVGRVGPYIIPAHFKSRFAGLEGQYLEVESSPLDDEEWALGPIVMQEIYDIRTLPRLPLEIEFHVKRTSADERSVDVVVLLKNTSPAPVEIDSRNLLIQLHEFGSSPRGRNLRRYSSILSKQTGYTARQLRDVDRESHTRDGTHRLQFLDYFAGVSREHDGVDGHTVAARNDSSMGLGFLLLPQESVPYFWRTSVAKPGRHELAVRYAHYVRETQSYLIIQAWKAMNAPLRKEQTSAKSLAARATVRTELVSSYGDWEIRHQIEGRLMNESDRSRQVFANKRAIGEMEDWRARELAALGCCLPGEVVIYGPHGKSVTGRVDWPVPDGLAKRRTIGPEGIPFRFQVCQEAKWRGHPIERIELWMITDEGLEKVSVANAVPFVEFPELPWGATVQGIRCRIRPVKESYSAGDEISLGFEIESELKTTDVLDAHVDLTYDGKTVRWFDTAGWRFPFRTVLPLRDKVHVTPGSHKFQLTVQGSPGKGMDAKGRESRAFDGTLVSNELVIEVFEAGQH